MDRNYNSILPDDLNIEFDTNQVPKEVIMAKYIRQHLHYFNNSHLKILKRMLATLRSPQRRKLISTLIDSKFLEKDENISNVEVMKRSGLYKQYVKTAYKDMKEHHFIEKFYVVHENKQKYVHVSINEDFVTFLYYFMRLLEHYTEF